MNIILCFNLFQTYVSFTVLRFTITAIDFYVCMSQLSIIERWICFNWNLSLNKYFGLIRTWSHGAWRRAAASPLCGASVAAAAPAPDVSPADATSRHGYYRRTADSTVVISLFQINKRYTNEQFIAHGLLLENIFFLCLRYLVQYFFIRLNGLVHKVFPWAQFFSCPKSN